MCKFISRLKNISVKKKIQLLLLCCVFLLLLVSMMSILFLSKRYEHILYESIYEKTLYASSRLENILSDTSNLADSILADQTIQEELPLCQDPVASKLERARHQTNIYNTLGIYLMSSYNNYISYVTILQDENDITSFYSWNKNHLTPDVRGDLLSRGMEAGGSTIWVTDYCSDYGLFLVKELREAKHFSFEPMGVLVICITPEMLMDQSIILEKSPTGSLYLLSDGDNIVYSTAGTGDEEILHLTGQFQNSYGTLALNNQKVFAVHTRLSDYGWDYICLTPYNRITNAYTLLRNIFLILACVTILLVFVIFEMLNSLFHQLNILLTKEAQLKTLESQMSPHFLYNTLDAIHWRAKMNGETEIADIASSLGILLRMSLRKDEGNFSIRQELSLVDHYMAIQLLRHRHRLDYHVHVQDSLLSCEIPKFTIQPLVENGVQYGLHGITDNICHVTVTISEYREDILIEVVNNGSCFDEDVLNNFSDHLHSSKGLGIALSNIDRRLKIAFGEKYGIKLLNHEDTETGEIYAIVYVYLPKRDLPETDKKECYV